MLTIGKKMRKYLALSFLVTSTLLFIAYSGPVSANENSISLDGIDGSRKLMYPEIIIELDQESIYVDVHPGSDGI